MYGKNNRVPECYCLYPATVSQIFLARARVVNDSPGTLACIVDLSRLARGGWFYMHKLAETIKAYRGIEWKEHTWPR